MNELDRIALTQTLPFLKIVPGVAVMGEWQEPQSAIWLLKLQFELQAVSPTADIPHYSDWVLLVDFNKDICGKVQLHPALGENGISVTFQHQQFNGGTYKDLPCKSGNICTGVGLDKLANSRNATVSEPTSTIDRILWHVSRAQQWLYLAATYNLAINGEPFELPDFDTRPDKPADFVLAYSEDNTSYTEWLEHPQRGVADITNLKGAFVVQRFLNEHGKVILEPGWGISIMACKSEFVVPWVRLNELPVVNKWQAPKTFTELVTVCHQQGIDLENELRPLWKRTRANKWGILLLGMPIPQKIGENSYRYHWQALEVIPLKAKTYGDKPSLLEVLANNKLRSTSAIRWHSKAENWFPSELQNRGRLNKRMATAKIVLFGAGALGSVLGEQLIRMGVEYLTIIDKENLEAGNLVRHTLDLSHLNSNKAIALAQKLNLVSPSAKVTGLNCTIPSNDSQLLEALETATLIIDCTADDTVLKALPFGKVISEAPIISCSLGLNAKRLFFYADLAKTFSWQTFDSWFQPFRQEESELADQIELPQGIGCWHPLTPAPLNRIAGLTGMAIELIEQVYLNKTELPVLHCEIWPDLSFKNRKYDLTPMFE